MRYSLLALAFSLVPLAVANNSSYSVKTPPLDTPWTYTVGTDPWPEYPRPQRARSQWQSLNGIWTYQNASGSEDVNNPPFALSNSDSGQPILVPSCIESGLSGVQKLNATHSWFSTTFTVPQNWTKEDRILLNFGAVDYEATVFVNSKTVAFHRGGYFEFTVDITNQTNRGGETNDLLVFVHDPTDSDPYVIPVGKQTLNPGHIFYRACSGIWQSVWIESAPANYITDLHLDADMYGQINVTVSTAGKNATTKTSTALVSVYEKNSSSAIASHQCQIDAPCQFSVPSPKLWSPQSPSLYDVEVRVGSDSVHSYTGFRTITKSVVNSVMRPILNGEPIFQMGTLDQGFWPDGLYTPPNREAMEYDLKVLKQLGFNMLRKHIKVETALFYQSCDELGLLLIQDMPALRQNSVLPNTDQQAEFRRQLKLLIKQLRNYPSIGTWVIYNEGWGQITETHPEFELTDLVRSIDPTRLIDSTTGWYDHGAGDYSDNHHYANPQCGTPFYSTQSSPYDPSRIAIQGEFGGIGNNVSIDHLWNVQTAINNINQTYELDESLAAWNFRGHQLLGELLAQTELFSCSGAVWTQTTDVEGEVNGLLTYDRRILRPDVAQWRKDIEALYDAVAERAANSTVPAPYTGAGPDGKTWWNYESLDWMPSGYQA